eukprot:CAMPEP_0194481302 /NCGR_PEP_ID=MMETSP0253-20130528/3784_1 /TAXON_ID=2966 /ORGANISM="Noctiluca scintillans" /LENGTH=119 /DNA_ID=CAMNT_0039320777 /DNA_START=976 /DNA_END=1332 /DNA_ORIENTATION=-
MLYPPTHVLFVGELGPIKHVVALQPIQTSHPSDVALGKISKMPSPTVHPPSALNPASGVMDGLASARCPADIPGHLSGRVRRHKKGTSPRNSRDGALCNLAIWQDFDLLCPVHLTISAW